MAQIFPSIEKIERRIYRRPIPNATEVDILSFLDSTLDNTYEIFYKPLINGLRPTYAIFKEGSGLLLIDFYDSYFENFSINTIRS